MTALRLTSAIAAASLVLAVAGCSPKQVDAAVTGAELVPGTGNLWRFCDGSTLIYYSNYADGSSDEYEFIVYEGCSADPAAEPTVSNLPDGDQ